MAFIQQEEERTTTKRTDLRGRTLAERLLALERKERLMQRAEITEEKKKEFKWPFKWKRKFSASKRKRFFCSCYSDIYIIYTICVNCRLSEYFKAEDVICSHLISDLSAKTSAGASNI